jgi:uridine kinase
MAVEAIIKRDGRVVVFNKIKIVDAIFRAVVGVGGSDRALAERLADEVVKKTDEAFSNGVVPTVEGVQDIVEKTLVEHGHYKTAKAYILYRAEHERIREKKSSHIAVEDNIPYKLLWKVFTWNVDHRCDNIERLNEHIEKATFPGLIEDAEKLYHSEISKVAGKIVSPEKNIRVVIVAGPSSSGKTTTTIKIGEKMKERGKEFVLLGLDNYFRNLDQHPKDEYGDHDYESPQALDLPLINEHLSELLAGRKVQMPIYDFKTGKRISKTKEFELLPNQILLIDSLHGLYPDLTSNIPHELKFKFYIESLCQIKDTNGEFVRWTDLRMLRRMVRDSWHRAFNPEKTVGHWHYVRASEKKYIVPFINKADHVFNGSMPYELPLYRKHLYRLFPDIIKSYSNDPKKLDASIRATRVYDLLSQVKELEDESCVPLNSVVREFIGGSSYQY